MGATPYVCVIEAELHVSDSQSLKSKRKVVRSIKDTVRKRTGAAVAEIAGHDTWQRTVLLFALVGGPEVAERADELVRLVEAQLPEGVTFRRDLRTLEDLRGL